MRMCVLVWPFRLRFQLHTTSLFATFSTRLRFVLLNSHWRFTFAIHIVNSHWQFTLAIFIGDSRLSLLLSFIITNIYKGVKGISFVFIICIFCMLGKNFSRQHFEIFFLFFPRK